VNGRQYLFSTKCLLEFVLGKYATPFQMKTKEKRLLQKQVSAKPNIGLKQYQHLLEKKTMVEEATTFCHELDFEEKRKRKTLPNSQVLQHMLTTKTWSCKV